MSASCDISRFLRGMERAKARARAAAKKGLGRFAWHVIGDAQQLTPVKTETLQGSGTVEEVQVKGDSMTVRAGFNTNYAAAVHEVLTAHHEVGQAKFLETAVRRNEPKMDGYIGGYVNEAL